MKTSNSVVRVERKDVAERRAVRAAKNMVADENLEREANRVPKYVHPNGEKAVRF